MKVKGKKIILFLIFMLLAMFCTYDNVLAVVKINSLKPVFGYYDNFIGQFDVIGNYGEDNEISTTFGNYGFSTGFKLGNKEVRIGDDDFDNYDEEELGYYYDLNDAITNSDVPLEYKEHVAKMLSYFNSLSYKGTVKLVNGNIVYEESGFGKLEISAKNVSTNVVVVTYKLTNNTGKKTTFSLGSAADIEFGSNDAAAISKKSTSFVITQDNEIEYFSTYGAQLNITLDSNPTTTFIGEYWPYIYLPDFVDKSGKLECYENYCQDFYLDGNYKYFMYDNTDVEYYTVNDDVDTALAYSWQGIIDAGETVTYTATFGLRESEVIDLNFFLKGEDGNYLNHAEGSPISVLGGGAFFTPNTSIEPEEGYNIKWYTNKEGKGQSYYPNSWVVAPNENTNYYEVKKSNNVALEEEKKSNYGNAEIIFYDDLMKEFEEDIKISYDDVKIALEVEKIDDSSLNEEKTLIEEIINDKYVLGSYINVDLYKLITSEDMSVEKKNVHEISKPISIKINIPNELINTSDSIFRDYKLVGVHNGVAEIIPSTYDEKTHQLTFETNKFSVYAIVYNDTVIDNPNTGDNIIKYLILGFVGLAGLVVLLLYLKKKKK